MDAKLTLSFDATVIEKAKIFADQQGISLSRLIEILLRKATTKSYSNIEELPISEWVQMVAEGETEYTKKPKSRKQMKEEFFQSKK